MTTQPRRLRLAAAALLTSLALTSCTAGPAQHMTSPDFSPVTATVEAAQATGQAAVEAIEAEQARQAELQRIAEERAAAEKAERQRIAAEKAERERQQRIAEERAAAEKAERERIAAEQAQRIAAERAAAEQAAAEQAAKEQAEREQPQKAAAERAQRAPAKKTEPASQKASAPKEVPSPAGPESVASKAQRFRAALNAAGGAGVPMVIDPADLPSSAGATYRIGAPRFALRSSSPSNRIVYLGTHEAMHHRQFLLAGGTVEGFDAQAAKANRIYGGSGYSGMDQQADCAAIFFLGGLEVTPRYTTDCSGARGDAARALLRGEPLR